SPRPIFWANVISLLAAATPARAELRADELLLVFNADSPESRELAGYYRAARQVPEDRLLGLKLSPGVEDISAADFESRVRGPIAGHSGLSPAAQEVFRSTCRGLRSARQGRQNAPGRAALQGVRGHAPGYRGLRRPREPAPGHRRQSGGRSPSPASGHARER